MPTLTDLTKYCDQRTRRTAFKDAPGAFNGLQFANSGRVTKIGAAVDAGLVPFQKAAAAGVNFLIVHHGMYWDMPRTITGPVYDRVTEGFGTVDLVAAKQLLDDLGGSGYR